RGHGARVGLEAPESPDRHTDRALADLSFRRRLTARAEIHVIEAVPRLHDRRAAARARLALVAAHLHVVADLRPALRREMLLDLQHPARDRVLQRSVKARHLLV